MSSNKIDVTKWVDDYGDYLLNFAYTRVHNKEVAEDLIQETFLAGVRGKDGFKGNSSERTWLVAILKRKIIDYYRKASRSKEDKLLDDGDYFRKDGILKGHWEENEAPHEWNIAGDAILERKEIMDILNSSMAKLPPKMSAVFTMRAIEGYSTEEVCKYLEITPSNMWVIMHRAKLLLRKTFEKQWMTPTG